VIASPVAVIVPPPHLWVVPVRHGTAGVGCAIATQFALAGDLISRQERRRLEMA